MTSRATTLRGMAYFRIGDAESAMADLDRAIRLDPAFSEAYLNRGTVRLAVGDAVQAAQDFSMVLPLEPRRAAEAYRLQGVAHASMGWELQAASDRRMAESLRGVKMTSIGPERGADGPQRPWKRRPVRRHRRPDQIA